MSRGKLGSPSEVDICHVKQVLFTPSELMFWINIVMAMIIRTVRMIYGGSKLEYAEDAGVETPKARVVEPVYRMGGGRRLLSDPFPRVLIKEGPKRKTADYEKTMGVMLVSKAFRDVLESLEPDAHQFEPVEVRWNDDSHAANMYIFVVCTALDSVAADHVEGMRKLIDFGYGDNIQRLGTWKAASGSGALRPNKVIFDLNAVGRYCVWQDEFLVGGAFCSDVFKDECVKTGLTGMVFSDRAFV